MIRFNEKKFQNFWISKFFTCLTYNEAKFHHFAPLIHFRKVNSSSLNTWMVCINQNAERLWDQNDPWPCLKGELNPNSSFLKKNMFFIEKSNGKSKTWTCNLPVSSQALYQLSYAAKIQNISKFYYIY